MGKTPHYRRIIVALAVAAGALALVACSAKEAPTATPVATATAAPKIAAPVPAGFARPELLVDTTWLDAHQNDANVRIVDVRAATAYQDGHIPNAVSLLSTEYSATVGTVGNELVSPEQIAKVLGAQGIGNNTRVVIYDDGTTLAASRLLWTLDYFGHTNNSILNGGFPAWQADGKDTSRKAPTVTAATFTPKQNPDVLADKAQVTRNINSSSVCILDARTPGEYAGTDVRAPATRGGHVPSAKNVNYEQDFVKQSNGVYTIKSPAELKDIYKAAGITPDKEVITYCQSGVRAAQSYFTLRLLGYGSVRNYDGSWMEWGSDANTPIEK